MKNLDLLVNFYENDGEEELRLQENSAHYLEFLTATKYLQKYLAPCSKVLDNCAGSGAYSFFLASLGHSVTAGDIVSYNVGIIEQKQLANPILSEIYCGDALDQSRFEAESFDAILCMGALYHLDSYADRLCAVGECTRLMNADSLFICTYMNRYAVILNNSIGSLDNIDEILQFSKDGKEGVFYASSPEEMGELMEASGLEVICHVALDGVSNFMHSTAKLIDDDGLKKWRDYHFEVCETPSLLGYSYHNMIIAKKRIISV